MRDPKMAMEFYKDRARAHFDSSPQGSEDETRLHQLHLASLGLSEQAKQHLVNKQLPDVAARLSRDDAEGEKIRSLPGDQQVAALDKIHDQEQRGATSESDQEEQQVSDYLAARAAAGRRPGAR